MKPEGWWCQALAARYSDVLLFSEPESPAFTHQVAEGDHTASVAPAQARQQDAPALYPEDLRPDPPPVAM